ncbi:unnamed protein product [Sphagnum compactum]
MTGVAQFNKLSAQPIRGANSVAIKEKRVTTVQALSGTGSLRVGAEFLSRHYGMIEDLRAASVGAVVLLHACAHNLTGVDPTIEQWEGIHKVIRSKQQLPFFDCAYQGFTSGSLDTNAHAVRTFVADGGECVIAQSYAKNMGLYGERVGALSIA